ncbi:MAG: creatininase family protein [Acidobacteria bacterium]|nr:creatininase family protein [Acidobacteriota bacterium]
MKRALLFAALTAAAPVAAQAPDTVFLEELTWVEVRDALKAGKTTVIVPTGGTEQNGPHMPLGKHNFRIRHFSNLIARALGNTLVAPVMAYVPEGELEPATGHMRFPGTITLPDEHFRKVLEYAARSLRRHGFRNIVFIGDSGPNQPGMKAVAEMLNAEWKDARVHFIAEYYRGNGFEDWLLTQGETKEAVGTHAGIHDTSLLLAVDPKLVRMNKRALNGGFEGSGVAGDPRRATAAYGQRGVRFVVETTVRRIREEMAKR